MVLYAYDASHAQFTPTALVRYVRLAEQAGFTAISSSEHLQPWSPRQAQSGFAWAWVGAAMQVTFLPFSVVCAPGQRYHPVVIAHAGATLAELFPGRFRLALGSGETLNDRVLGEPWPPKSERHAGLLECVDLLQTPWAGRTVTHYAGILIEEGRLYTRPEVPLGFIGAAVTAETARWVSRWADGLLTVGGALETVRYTLIVSRNPSSRCLEHASSWRSSKPIAHAPHHGRAPAVKDRIESSGNGTHPCASPPRRRRSSTHRWHGRARLLCFFLRGGVCHYERHLLGYPPILRGTRLVGR